MSIGTGIATGKIILMGEHSVVYGEPAIAFPFAGAKVQVEITANETSTLISSYYHGLLEEVPSHLKMSKTCCIVCNKTSTRVLLQPPSSALSLLNGEWVLARRSLLH